MSDVLSASDREPQRKALTDLISRFTADRDRLIAVVQDCEARLEDLAGRSRGHDSHAAAPDAPSVPSADLDDVRAAMRELNDEIQTLRARETNVAANTAVQALATESAQTRKWIDDLRAEFTRLRAEVERTATQVREAIEDVGSSVTRIEVEVAARPEEVWQRVERALEPLSGEMRSLGERLVEVERGLRSATVVAASPSAGGAERAAGDSSDAVAELRAVTVRMDQRMDERTEELWRRVEKLVGPISAEVRAAAARGTESETAMRERLATHSGRVAALAGAVERLERTALEHANDTSPQLVAVDATLHRLQDEQRRLHDEAATDIARTRGALTALTDRVGHLEAAVAQTRHSVLSALYDEVWEALRARVDVLTGGILHEVGAWLPRLPDVLRLVRQRAHG